MSDSFFPSTSHCFFVISAALEYLIPVSTALSEISSEKKKNPPEICKYQPSREKKKNLSLYRTLTKIEKKWRTKKKDDKINSFGRS